MKVLRLLSYDAYTATSLTSLSPPQAKPRTDGGYGGDSGGNSRRY